MNRFLKLNLPIKIGVLLLVIGTSPLLIVILTDTLGIIDAPNPAVGCEKIKSLPPRY